MNANNTSQESVLTCWSGARAQLKRMAWVGLFTLILSGCSVVQSLYNNAPQLVYWWLDDYVDFRADQKDWAKAKLTDLLAWHRTSQLPLYLVQLKKLAELSTGDITPEVGCGAVQALIDTQGAWLDQLSAPLAEFLQSLSLAQIQHLQVAFEKKNKEWSKEWLLVSDKERLEHQTDKGIEQAQDLYGKLSVSQKDALRQLAKDSGYDAPKSLGLRRARQQETLKAVDQLRMAAKTPDKGRPLGILLDNPRTNEPSAQTSPVNNAPLAPTSLQSQALVREWLLNVLEPVDPALRTYNTLRWNMNCQASSRFHALTTPEQRQHAKARLLRYARDAQELMDKSP